MNTRGRAWTAWLMAVTIPLFIAAVCFTTGHWIIGSLAAATAVGVLTEWPAV